jgi:hypothetical protein
MKRYDECEFFTPESCSLYDKCRGVMRRCDWYEMCGFKRSCGLLGSLVTCYRMKAHYIIRMHKNAFLELCMPASLVS